MTQTNILTPELMYGNEGFLDWLVRLEPFHSDIARPPMSANQFYWACRLSFECGLRVSEMLKLIKSDFDLEHKILTIRDPKTAKGSIQFTTILPNTALRIKKLLDNFEDNERIFPTTRSTMWKYYKNTSTIAGMDIYTIRETQIIKGAWTHMMRNSCARMYEEVGASPSLINKKMRWSASSMLQRYNRVEITDVVKFDEKYFSEIPKYSEVN